MVEELTPEQEEAYKKILKNMLTSLRVEYNFVLKEENKRVCTHCGKPFSISVFSPSGRFCGLLCSRKHWEKYYETNKEKINETKKKYYEANKEKIKETKKKWKDANKEKIKEYRETNKKWKDANKEKIKETKKKYYEANKDKILAKKKIFK